MWKDIMTKIASSIIASVILAIIKQLKIHNLLKKGTDKEKIGSKPIN